jgi:hypothetical protein
MVSIQAAQSSIISSSTLAGTEGSLIYWLGTAAGEAAPWADQGLSVAVGAMGYLAASAMAATPRAAAYNSKMSFGLVMMALEPTRLS